MPRMGNPSISKIMFAHIALLGFQRAGGTVRRFRHDHYFTPLSRFCKRGKTIFSSPRGSPPHAGETAAFRNAHLSSLVERKSVNRFERRLADAFTPGEARQMFKLPRISRFASRCHDFF